MKKEPKFKIIKESTDPTACIIEKSNISVEFTLADMMQEEEELKRYIRQWEGQVNLEAAKVKNIVQHHPFVLEMSEKDLFTAHMYQESRAVIKVLEPKIAEFKEQLSFSEKAREDIEKQTGLRVPDKSKEAIVDEAVSKITE